ncbi:MAG: acetyl-CoA carboxylase biotin carboxyl carrier protein subunit [Rhodospirillales bacterium]
MAKTTNDKGGGVDHEIVRKLADLLEETGLNEIEIGRDGWHVRVSKGGGQVVAAPAASAPAAGSATAPAASDGGGDAVHPGAVPAPMVGVVYLSPDPNSEAFVKVGDQVEEGATICLIEAMKVFNPIRAPRAGKVARILVTSGSPVEYGEPLVVIE